MTVYFAELALLPHGWANDVSIDVNKDGSIEIVSTDSTRGKKELLNGIVVPGMPNLHSHAFQRAMAGLTERRTAKADSFWTWRKTMYNFLTNFSPETTRAIASQLYVEMLKAGFTSVGEFHYLHHQTDGTAYDNRAELSHSILDAADITEIGITHLPVLYQSGGFGGVSPNEGQRPFLNDLDEYLEIVTSSEDRIKDDLNKAIGVAPHSLRAVPLDQLEQLLKIIPEDWPVHIHIAEQVKEVNDCLAWCGMSPVSLLMDRFPVNERWCAIHATHMTASEVKSLARSGAVAGLCPITEGNLGDGVFRLPSWIKAGGALGVGSDSNVLISMTEELRTLEYSQRFKRHERSIATTDKEMSPGAYLFKAAVAGGSQALARKTGQIEKSYRADLLVLDNQNPALVHHTPDSLLDALVFGTTTNPVKDVMVGGNMVIENHHHYKEDEIFEVFSTNLASLRTAT